jgi:hypothetical protein
MPSFGTLRLAALIITDFSEERDASSIRLTRIGELKSTLAIFSSLRLLVVTVNFLRSTPLLVTLIMVALRSYETSVLTRATQRNIPEDVFFIVTAVKI